MELLELKILLISLSEPEKYENIVINLEFFLVELPDSEENRYGLINQVRIHFFMKQFNCLRKLKLKVYSE